MATDEQKQKNLDHLTNDVITAFAKGLYDLFEDSALAVIRTVGSTLLTDMEQKMGLEIAGEKAQDILTEIGRLLVDEYGLSQDMTIAVDDDQINITVKNCRMWSIASNLGKEDIPPFTCVPMMMASAALYERAGTKSKFESIKQDEETKSCYVAFRTN